MNEPRHDAKFRRTVQRLTVETRNIRGVFAAWQAWHRWVAAGGSTANLFLQTAGWTLQSDLMIRLMRVLDLDPKTCSFWYLHRCGLFDAGSEIDSRKLEEFSKKLRGPRNKVFAHIDQDALFDHEKYYREADINDSDIAYAIDQLWNVLCHLRLSYGEPLGNFDTQNLQSLCQDFRRDFLELLDRK